MIPLLFGFNLKCTPFMMDFIAERKLLIVN